MRSFRRIAIRYALAITAMGAVGAWFVSAVALRGFLLGSLAGIAGFWIMAARLEKIALTRPDEMHIFALTWSMWRFAIYGVALAAAYFLDRDSMHGLVAAAVGIMVIRFVLIYLGITQKRAPSADQ